MPESFEKPANTFAEHDKLLFQNDSSVIDDAYPEDQVSEGVIGSARKVEEPPVLLEPEFEPEYPVLDAIAEPETSIVSSDVSETVEDAEPDSLDPLVENYLEPESLLAKTESIETPVEPEPEPGPAAAREPAAEALTREQLSQLKLGALIRRAVAQGVDAAALDEAEDSSDPQCAIIALLLPPSGGRTGR